MKLLINTKEELKAQLGGVQKEMAFPTWEPAIRRATSRYIVKSIGSELYDELTSLTGPANAYQAELLTKLKAAVAFFAFLENLPFLATQTGDAGLVMPAVANATTLTKWMYVTIYKEAGGNSDFWLEDSLQYLEQNAGQFPVWTASDAYTVNFGHFIGSASQLTKAFPAAKNSRRLFLEIRDYVFKSEAELLPAIMGEDFTDALLARLKDASSTFTPKEVRVLELCREAVANHAFEKALPYTNLNSDFRIVSETDGIVNEDELPGERLNMMLASVREGKANAVAKLTAYLDANASATVFPEYFTSDRYRPPVAVKSGKFKNQPGNKFFAM